MLQIYMDECAHSIAPSLYMRGSPLYVLQFLEKLDALRTLFVRLYAYPVYLLY
jgi:hypothetical protein